MEKGAHRREPDAPSVTATRGEPVGQVLRNHVLFGTAIVAGLLLLLIVTGSP